MGKNFADCTAIPADVMGRALGNGQAMGTSPNGKSCTYRLGDPRLPSVSIEQFTVADFADGWAGAKSKVDTTVLGKIKGTPQAVSGVGDDAIVVAGPSDAQANPDAIGLVRLGDVIVRASVIDFSGLTDSQAAQVAIDVLKVIAAHR